MMLGQTILARAMSGMRSGKHGEQFQYNSRSDHHSKVACWTLLFDAVRECDVIEKHARSGLLGFGINYEMVGPINKTLDMVLTRVPSTREAVHRTTFVDLAKRWNIPLEEKELAWLSGFGNFVHDDAADDLEVVLALEAKACMTAHVKALPRLHAEILATGFLAKRSTPRCIVVSYTLINSAETFLPSGEGEPKRHKQPQDAQRVLDMLANAIPLSRDHNNLVGYDVVGASILRAPNDGTPVHIDTKLAWPERSDHIRYERMIRSLCSEYRARASG